MPIYRFECPAGHVTEDLVPMGTETIKCQHKSVPSGWEDLTRTTEEDLIQCKLTATKRAQTSIGRPQGGPTPVFHRRGNQ